MRTAPPPGGKRVSEWVGKTVRTKRAMSNGYVKIPAGTVCRVREASGGLRLETDSCEHCGRGAYITRVSHNDVAVVS